MRAHQSSAESEIAAGNRFAFGRNWRQFARSVSPAQVEYATRSLQRLVGRETLNGQRFLDAGCGSGLSSLAAYQLGAVVHSFDYDDESVATTADVAQRFGADPERWRVEQGSVLDSQYVAELGQFDIAYSWGVVHHTGDQWTAIRNLTSSVRPGGTLALALYNDQGVRSVCWRWVKRLYCAGPVKRAIVIAIFVPFFAGGMALVSAKRHGNPMTEFRLYHQRRGMSPYRDWLDWLGGLPFEVSTPQAVIDFAAAQGFVVDRLQLTRRLGCNEFTFRRRAD